MVSINFAVALCAPEQEQERNIQQAYGTAVALPSDVMS